MCQWDCVAVILKHKQINADTLLAGRCSNPNVHPNHKKVCTWIPSRPKGRTSGFGDREVLFTGCFSPPLILIQAELKLLQQGSQSVGLSRDLLLAQDF